MKQQYILVTASALLFASTAFAGHHEDAVEKWQKADTNKDTFLSEEEFVAMKRDWFKKIDTNHDGKLSAEENKEAMEDMKDKASH